MLGKVDDAHPAFAELLHENVSADLHAAQIAHAVGRLRRRSGLPNPGIQVQNLQRFGIERVIIAASLAEHAATLLEWHVGQLVEEFVHHIDQGVAVSHRWWSS